MATGAKELLFKAPEHPKEVFDNMQYGMNSYALQLNALSDEMKAKLPPTDCRLRPDLRLWEQKDSVGAEKEKTRLENNQAKRRQSTLDAKKAALSKADIDKLKEQDLYEPRFFNRTEKIDKDGERIFHYTPIEGKYWQQREQGQWPESPLIYDDSCDQI